MDFRTTDRFALICAGNSINALHPVESTCVRDA